MPRKKKTRIQLHEEIHNFVIHGWDDRNLPVLLEFAFLSGKANAFGPKFLEIFEKGASPEALRQVKALALRHLHECEAQVDKLISENEILYDK